MGMEGQNVPNLEEMDDQQARRFLEEIMSDLSAESGYEVRHEDFVMEIPPVRRAHPRPGEDEEGAPGGLRASCPR